MPGLYIQTFGCQMNVSDSDRMKAQLTNIGFESVEAPGQADLILINTCAVREGAETKMAGFANQLRAYRREKPELVIGITGCVAQEEKEKILVDMPFVDLVLGPDNIDDLSWSLEEIASRRARGLPTQLVHAEFDTEPRVWKTRTEILNAGPTAFVSVMKGCDHFCSYCIVPYTRGREKSRPMADVVDDVKRLIDRGVKEVTFLGQNINTYGKRSEDGDTLEGLFRAVHDLPGLERIRFTTSHPGDLKDGLIECYRDLPKLCSSFHLPVQSGSDRVLRSMRRFYTREQYLERIARIREARPDVAFSTDIIVGFPGETEEDVELTISLLETVRYDNVYSFLFSPRPGTSAADRKDGTSEGLRLERLTRVQNVNRRVSRELHEAFAGRTVEILIEGPSKKDPNKWTGRNSQNVVVHIDRDEDLRPGDLVKVEVLSGNQTHLKARRARAADATAPAPEPRA